MLLEEISGPEDLRALGNADLDRLCAEIRERLINAVARTGGHLGPNLGVVELTVAIHPETASSSTPATRRTSTRCSPAAPIFSARCASTAG